jgi:hypothetical protein
MEISRPLDCLLKACTGPCLESHHSAPFQKREVGVESVGLSRTRTNDGSMKIQQFRHCGLLRSTKFSARVPGERRESYHAQPDN